MIRMARDRYSFIRASRWSLPPTLSYRLQTLRPLAQVKLTDTPFSWTQPQTFKHDMLRSICKRTLCKSLSSVMKLIYTNGKLSNVRKNNSSLLRLLRRESSNWPSSEQRRSKKGPWMKFSCPKLKRSQIDPLNQLRQSISFLQKDDAKLWSFSNSIFPMT